MDATLKIWIVIVAVGVLNFLLRLSFIAVFARREMPPLLARALKFVPAAMLTALIVPMVVGTPIAAPAWWTPRVIAMMVAGVAAFYTRNALPTLVAGMAALWLLQWLMPNFG
jgi:branched-subunit amino acid transport protein